MTFAVNQQARLILARDPADAPRLMIADRMYQAIIDFSRAEDEAKASGYRNVRRLVETRQTMKAIAKEWEAANG